MIIRFFSGYLLFLCFLITTNAGLAFSDEDKIQAKTLAIDDFIRLATAKDTEFERILIDELLIHYQKDLKLPADDLILSVKQQYEIFIDQDRSSPATTVSLSRLFPESGTEVLVAYDMGASIASEDKTSTVSFSVSQPIARNAFGKSTKLLDKMVGLETAVARHQVVEAYEDYLALVTSAYYDWYENYQNLRIGQSSYTENRKLLKNIKKRQAKSIALSIDVNKVELQVLAKRESILALEEKLKTSLHLIQTFIRYEGKEQLIPVEPPPLTTLSGSFEQLFDLFTKESRTFNILRELEKKSSLQVARDADDLFPSIDLTAGLEIQGGDYFMEDSNQVLSVGLSIQWPFDNQVEKAELGVSNVVAEKTKLETQSAYFQLYSQLISLYLKIERENKLIKIADEKIALARAIVNDESENYSFGKVSLNDYIQAVNVLDTNRFNQVSHTSLLNKLLLEWLRLTDQLVNRKDIQKLP